MLWMNIKLISYLFNIYMLLYKIYIIHFYKMKFICVLLYYVHFIYAILTHRIHRIDIQINLIKKYQY